MWIYTEANHLGDLRWRRGTSVHPLWILHCGSSEMQGILGLAWVSALKLLQQEIHTEQKTTMTRV